MIRGTRVKGFRRYGMQVFRWIGIIIKWVPHVVSAVVTIEGLLGEVLVGVRQPLRDVASAFFLGVGDGLGFL